MEAISAILRYLDHMYWSRGSEGCRFSDLATGRHIARPEGEFVTLYRMEFGEEHPIAKWATATDAQLWIRAHRGLPPAGAVDAHLEQAHEEQTDIGDVHESE